MGQKYCRPEPCYHGHGYQPPSKRNCSCRPRSSLLIISRGSKSSFGSHPYRQKHRRS